MAKLKSAAVEKVKQVVQEHFAEIEGVEPTIAAKTLPSSTDMPSSPLYVLTFRHEMVLEDGGRMARIVRVTADEEGKVIKLSASR